MKAEERHHLKDNELVQWLIGLPQWARENSRTILIVGGLLILAVAAYGWYYYERDLAPTRTRIDFSERVNQLYNAKQQAAREGATGKDLSFLLSQAADRLGQFAAGTDDRHIAALAYIKQGEAIRASLHSKPQQLATEQIAPQIELARQSYNKALALASGDPTLMALAKYGLGLCSEELGQYDQAGQLYLQIAQDPNLNGTVGQAAARYRLATFQDYTSKVVFRRLASSPSDANKPSAPADANTVPTIIPPAQATVDANAGGQ
ncbi:MAG: hypothetical protein QHH07_07190 [Sedimentisphaerales bacterium]|jgi:tetratricopeptide (TPR) repeat protein|nr:hypothetical protein [Sedimentisphaerales bacterium]